MTSARANTTRGLDTVDEGLFDARHVGLMCVNAMSESEVSDMMDGDGLDEEPEDEGPADADVKEENLLSNEEKITMKLHPTTQLERAVAKWIKEQEREDYPGATNDLLEYGCQSGMVSGLVYYTDTIKFYKAHKKEIQAILRELCDETGSTPETLFRDQWEKEDFFAEETPNQNLLAWFGFEETARRLVEREEMEAC